MDTAHTSRPPLSAVDRRELLHVARAALTDYLSLGRRPHPRTDAPALREHRAAFVTLWHRHNDDLRGCRGEVEPRQALVDSVAQMTISSAVDDPRFPHVTLAEVPHLKIEINALTRLFPIVPDDIEIGRHGLMIASARGTGLLLPEVATRYGWAAHAFLAATCQKAGLPDDAWRDAETRVYGFESDVWSE